MVSPHTAVFDDANISNTIEGLLSGKYRGSGQTCVSPNRIFIQAGIHDEFVAKMQMEIEQKMRVGPLDEEDTTLGCLINTAAADKVERLVRDARAKGANLVLGGERSKDQRKTFYPATILTGMNASMQASHEEIFGPLVAVYKFKTEDEVIELANDSSVGLAAYIFTNDLSTSWRMAEKLEGTNSL